MSTLLLEYWVEKNDFHLYASNSNTEKELILEGQAKEILEQFHSLYDILENQPSGKDKKIQSITNDLGAQLLTPFTDLLASCSLVRIWVDDETVRCAFDLLTWNAAPLFLQREVCYQLEEEGGDDQPNIQLESALIIADLTADPEEAGLQVSKLIPNARYLEAPKASLKMIRDAAANIDTFLLSAHGELDEENSGGIYLNDNDMVEDELMGQMQAWIVYCDSCQQGINMDYLYAFQNDSDIQYYLAPIISNDAGDSSTRTMVWFYEGVMKHGDPIRSLFETRQRLYKYYKNTEKLDLITTLNKAFAFRIYEFVDASENDEDTTA